MKKLISLITLTATLMYSCTTDPCDGVTCVNGGTCLDGTCDCPDGYEGTDCSTEARAKWIGNYTSVTACAPGPDPSWYTSLVITPSTTNVMGIKLTYNDQGPKIIDAVLNADGNSFHATTSGGGVVFTADAILNGNTLTLEYTTVVGVTVEDCTLTSTKQ